MAENVATVDTAVLVLGESGTAKRWWPIISTAKA